MAMLMAAAQILTSMKSRLHGTVKFIFQPAEEGLPIGEVGGAEEMVKEGVLENPKVDAIFGLHIFSYIPVGTITYHPGGAMAAVNSIKIVVKGKSAHGAAPWSGVDPIVISAEIINSLQTIVSRNVNITENPAVVTIGSINGGNRENIIPDSVVMQGTLRSFTAADKQLLLDRVKEIATKTAELEGGTAKISYGSDYPVTYNDPALTAKMLPTLQQTAGIENVKLNVAITGAEDFSFYEQKYPACSFSLEECPKAATLKQRPSIIRPTFLLMKARSRLVLRPCVI
jgi:amidohydrolase